MPRTGGTVQAFRWPDLERPVWSSPAQIPPTTRIVDFAADIGRLTVADTSGRLIRLDLRRATVQRPSVPVRLALGGAADGELFAAEALTRAVYRTDGAVQSWRANLVAAPQALVPLARGGVLAVAAIGDSLLLDRFTPPDTAAAARATVAAGLLTSEAAGRVWVARAGSVDALDAKTLAVVATVRDLPAGAPLAIATTPSGNSVFVVHDKSPSVEVIDRYRGAKSASWALPAPGRGLRVDPLGRTLLVRPWQGESSWAVDIATGRVRSTLSTSWRDDLPRVLPDGTVLVVLGPDVAWLDADSLQRRGAVSGGASSWWHVVQWDGFRARGDAPPPPSFDGIDTAVADAIDSAIAATAAEDRESAESPPDTTATPAADSAARWLVSFASTVDDARAQALAAQLRAGGTAARVVSVEGARVRSYRVVLGPFDTRDAAVRAGRAAGREHWIVSTAAP
ncbi:MAG: SPOR domain-containing protein [Gemmatimonadaceae bacterium]|nr:SPOR domain-containing protein [Gemmatimonadaceae bacterium]